MLELFFSSFFKKAVSYSSLVILFLSNRDSLANRVRNRGCKMDLTEPAVFVCHRRSSPVGFVLLSRCWMDGQVSVLLSRCSVCPAWLNKRGLIDHVLVS